MTPVRRAEDRRRRADLRVHARRTDPPQPDLVLRRRPAVRSGAGAADGLHRTCAYNFEVDEKRFEGKVTQSLGGNHTVRGRYTDIRARRGQQRLPVAGGGHGHQPACTRGTLPQNLCGGALHRHRSARNFFVEAQYSHARASSSRATAAQFTDLDPRHGDAAIDQTGARWWAPTFCGVCAPEERANDDLLLKGNYFLLDGPRLAQPRVRLRHASTTSARATTTSPAATTTSGRRSSFIRRRRRLPGAASGRLGTYFIWWPIREASRGTNFRTHSLFFNDTWPFNRHFTFNLGLRCDKNDGKDAIGAAWSPATARSARASAWSGIRPARAAGAMNASYGQLRRRHQQRDRRLVVSGGHAGDLRLLLPGAGDQRDGDVAARVRPSRR